MEEATYDPELKAVLNDWCLALKQGTDYDLWGQPLEAIDCYKRLADALMDVVQNNDNTYFTDEQKKVLSKIILCLHQRQMAIKSPGNDPMTLSNMKLLFNSLKNVLILSPNEFPISVGILNHVPNSTGYDNKHTLSSEPVDSEALDESEVLVDQRFIGSLLPVPPIQPGQTLVKIRLECIDLKNAAQYINSFITISVKDPDGCDLSPAQDTPASVSKDDKVVYFDLDVYLQQPLELFPLDFAIFFEFKHYKPKKNRISTKCWTFMERDEVKEGKTLLELYKKPSNVKRKKLHLLTVKPMFLHLKLLLTS